MVPIMRILIILLLSAAPALADYTINGKTVDCYCTALSWHNARCR